MATHEFWNIQTAVDFAAVVVQRHYFLIEKKLQFITLLTTICIVSHIENSKNEKRYIT